MSYVRSLGEVECPPGWTRDAAGDCKSSPDVTQCPPQFEQRVPGECWPATNTACKDTFGTFFNPAEPDRCKKQCPPDLQPDPNNVCRPQGSAIASVLSSPTTVGMLVLGTVAVAIVLRGGFR